MLTDLFAHWIKIFVNEPMEFNLERFCFKVFSRRTSRPFD